jgi:hypothetical protein
MDQVRDVQSGGMGLWALREVVEKIGYKGLRT